jgi:hypothetical protein
MEGYKSYGGYEFGDRDRLDMFRYVHRDSGSSDTIKHIAHPREWVSIRDS